MYVGMMLEQVSIFIIRTNKTMEGFALELWVKIESIDYKIIV